ncbi:hypothetical protein F2Q69_00000254 [Brassica cretica]|uniref:Sulfotransferase n=1 Tax=Brassica cretica TaxID=69181 RepID=A0A8S9NQ73_BRACR|nr:hypothetical protein F2Q69_00000254 [Brassica cretica]
MADNELPMNLREDNVREETKKLISSLPTDKDCRGKLCKYQGCWYYHNTLQAVISFQNNFQPQETDIILSSSPKSGTTWLKALTVALLERSKHHDDHPLLSDNPHGIVPFLENNLLLKSSTPDLTKFSSASYVYKAVCDSHAFAHRERGPQGFSLQDCVRVQERKGRVVPMWSQLWDHVLSYWRGSLEDPSHVLFMKYEEMKEEPCVQLKRLAEFLGCPFTEEEEESGAVNKILQLCSLRSLSDLEINRTGKTSNGVDYKFYFRKGEVGDSKNHLTPEMESKIDMIIEYCYISSAAAAVVVVVFLLLT